MSDTPDSDGVTRLLVEWQNGNQKALDSLIPPVYQELRATAGRLHFELRKTDTAVRLDRGQFAAMLVDLHQPEEAQRVAAKVAAALAAPINVGVARLTLAARVGVVWSPAHGNQLMPLLQAAEVALAKLPAGQGGVGTP